MENIYNELFDSSHLVTDQIRGHLFTLVGPDGPVLAVVDTERRLQTTHPGKIGFLLGENARVLKEMCSRLDDGEDPLIIKVKGGCVAATQLATERVHCGYLLIFLEGYTPETVGANMHLVELILAQAQLVCDLVEKNNQLHRLRLVHLSRTSEVLSR